MTNASKKLARQKGSIIAYLMLALVMMGILVVTLTGGSQRSQDATRTEDAVNAFVSDLRTIEAAINDCVTLYPKSIDRDGDGDKDATDNPNAPFPYYNAGNPPYAGAGTALGNIVCPGAPAASATVFDNKKSGKFLRLLNVPGVSITYLTDATEGVRLTIARSGNVPPYWNDVVDLVNARLLTCQAEKVTGGACATNNCLYYWIKRRPTSASTEGGCP